MGSNGLENINLLSKEPLLKMVDISKSFPGVKALEKVKIEIYPGEVHALMGENGAGKSTLMKILTGLHVQDEGEIIYNGKQIAIHSPQEAINLGITMIHQELNPVYEMSVAENIFLGREPVLAFGGIVDHKKLLQKTKTILQEFGMEIDPNSKMKDLSISEMQMVEIIKAISYKSKLIIMDEPTSSISNKEVDKLFDIMNRLKKENVAFIYISHKMDEIYRIADKITILRDGKYIDTGLTSKLTYNELIRKMVGREISQIYMRSEIKYKKIALSIENLGKSDQFYDINFNLMKGEILGIYGLMGAGRTEVAETIFGIHVPYTGKIILEGKEIKIKKPLDAINAGMALVSEDRKLNGLNLCGSVKTNISIVKLKDFIGSLGYIKKRKEIKAVNEQIEKLKIKTSGLHQIVETLSGGNQQKIVLSKWLLGNPDVLILDEPTRGIDINAKGEIYKLIDGFAKEKKAVIFISSELPEVMGMCDRILVMSKGQITGEFKKKDGYDQEKILRKAMLHAG